MQAMPPETMENSVEVKFATTPDSTSPRRGPPVTTAIWIDEIRLRNSSVMACLQDGVAQHRRDDVHRPGDAETDESHDHDVHQSEQGHRRAPGDDDQRDQPPLAAHAGDPSGDDRHEEGPGAGSGVEQAEGPRSAVIQRERDGRKERPRESEDHGVEVDQIDRLHYGVRAHVAKAVPDGPKHRGAGVLDRRRQGREEEGQHGQQGEGGRVDGVTGVQTDAGDQHARDRGTDDDRGVEGDLIQ